MVILPATAISGGEFIQEYGGGICQVSSTIYGAALRSNMTIVTRYNHTYPSSYVPIGLDATVSYGSLDLSSVMILTILYILPPEWMALLFKVTF